MKGGCVGLLVGLAIRLALSCLLLSTVEVILPALAAFRLSHSQTGAVHIGSTSHGANVEVYFMKRRPRHLGGHVSAVCSAKLASEFSHLLLLLLRAPILEKI